MLVTGAAILCYKGMYSAVSLGLGIGYNSSMDEKELTMLIRRAKDGDKDAFSQLYMNYVTPVYRYVFSRVRNKSDAEDIVSDTFMRAYQAFARFEDEGKTLLPYLFTIARNLLINQSRKKKPDLIEQEQMDRQGDESFSPVREAMSSERSLALRASMVALSQMEREIVELRFFGEQSYAEIAVILEKREDAIRQHVARAMRKLRTHLGGQIEDI